MQRLGERRQGEHAERGQHQHGADQRVNPVQHPRTENPVQHEVGSSERDEVASSHGGGGGTEVRVGELLSDAPRNQQPA